MGFFAGFWILEHLEISVNITEISWFVALMMKKITNFADYGPLTPCTSLLTFLSEKVVLMTLCSMRLALCFP
jgi:hypothetical protein